MKDVELREYNSVSPARSNGSGSRAHRERIPTRFPCDFQAASKAVFPDAAGARNGPCCPPSRSLPRTIVSVLHRRSAKERRLVVAVSRWHWHAVSGGRSRRGRRLAGTGPARASQGPRPTRRPNRPARQGRVRRGAPRSQRATPPARAARAACCRRHRPVRRFLSITVLR